MVAFAYAAAGLPVVELGVLLFGFALLALMFQTPPHVARWRVVAACLVFVLLLGGVTVLLADGPVFPYTCDNWPWWDVIGYWLYCSANN